MYQPALHSVDRQRGAPVPGLERTGWCRQRFAGGLAGFTLVELLVVVAISALLLALAAPAFNGLISAQKSTALVGAFMDSLNFARSEAIKRGGRAVLCKSANGTGCSSAAPRPVCGSTATRRLPATCRTARRERPNWCRVPSSLALFRCARTPQMPLPCGSSF